MYYITTNYEYKYTINNFDLQSFTKLTVEQKHNNHYTDHKKMPQSSRKSKKSAGSPPQRQKQKENQEQTQWQLQKEMQERGDDSTSVNTGDWNFSEHNILRKEMIRYL